MTTLRTARLVLRPLTLDDFGAHYAMVGSDPNVTWQREVHSRQQAYTALQHRIRHWEVGGNVRLTVTHAQLAEGDMARQGWSAILSSLKSYLETGQPLSATEMWRARLTPNRAGHGETRGETA